MGKLVAGTFVTVDGVMQAPGGPDEDRDGGFSYGGWNFPHWDEEMGRIIDEQTNRGEALLLGRRTYEIFAGYWPDHGDDDGVGSKLNSMPKYVASTTLNEVGWNNSTLLGDDVPGEVARLKEQHKGEIHVTGSSNLIQTLLKNDLIDEFVIWTFPVVLGSGKRLFDGGTIPAGLEHVDTMVSGTGVVISTYRRAGEVKTGSF